MTNVRNLAFAAFTLASFATLGGGIGCLQTRNDLYCYTILEVGGLATMVVAMVVIICLMVEFCEDKP